MNSVKKAKQNYEAEYRQKLCTPEEAASVVKSGDHLCFPISCGEPTLFVRALAKRKRELEGVVVNQQHHLCPDYFTEDSAPHIKVNAWFTSHVSRQAVQEGWADFVPNYFHEVPKLLREYWPIDVAGTVVSPMDEHGYFTCSLSVAYTMEAVKKAKKVVLQVSPQAPRTHGNCHIHISEVSHIIECHEPLQELSIPPISPVEEAIGGYLSELIEDGSCLQLGWGGIPNSICKALLNKKDLGIHTELLSDGMVDLMLSGAVNNSKKKTHRGKTIATFALGTKRLYEFMHENPQIEMHPVDYVNYPHNIGKNDKVVSINATLQVDLLGQCCSESFGHLQYSGTGGQADFVRGSNISNGGKGFITLPSTAKDGAVSRIVPTLTSGASITTGKNDVDYVATEYGVAKLRGQTARQRALNLINIAHPDFREELMAAARKMNRI
ncbi:succinyl:benzoate coenzyme A transferase [Citrifermentans bemidjiense Bem]|uniref:Succinyl:benzoate coenzyme A transferase n=1 Tax=Citrifermentans bemidjiense (strain ATCC BAA-1014 / DSM 16622 / JCM 12645 / Bem) TaxID=404380 RepID=B5ECU8_CITBB|nr:acetyl-CoA hydrolase/transferase C-terminal domain-containing protein [Citrifermentans bemidjiense]ACH40565.1 succinyl:benzoate coenzyme A transferase [Citrifermentans bemidjiense Bem]